MSVAIGNLPEMHVRVGIVDRQEVVAIATQHLKAAAAAHDMARSAADPPRYL
jgi:hypothetical protein